MFEMKNLDCLDHSVSLPLHLASTWQSNPLPARCAENTLTLLCDVNRPIPSPSRPFICQRYPLFLRQTLTDHTLSQRHATEQVNNWHRPPSSAPRVTKRLATTTIIISCIHDHARIINTQKINHLPTYLPPTQPPPQRWAKNTQQYT